MPISNISSLMLLTKRSLIRMKENTNDAQSKINKAIKQGHASPPGHWKIPDWPLIMFSKISPFASHSFAITYILLSETSL